MVYIDGFNLYYGCLKGTPWKWLDLEALFGRILGPQNALVRIKYFTARIRPSGRDPAVDRRQTAYLRALSACCPRVEILYGHFLRHRVTMENACPPPPQVAVWKNEEKGSDVNLAVHMLNDAWQDAYDCAVVVSNDSDLSEALRLVRRLPRKIIGLVTPGAPARRTSAELAKYADFVKQIRPWALKACQLPDRVEGTTIRRPRDW